MSLFQKTIVSKYLKTQNQENIHLKWESFKEHFHNSEIQNNIRNSKEEEYQEGFFKRFIRYCFRLYFKTTD